MWLEWLLATLLQARESLHLLLLTIQLVDATIVVAPGRTGARRRIHLGLNLDTMEPTIDPAHTCAGAERRVTQPDAEPSAGDAHC